MRLTRIPLNFGMYAVPRSDHYEFYTPLHDFLGVARFTGTEYISVTRWGVPVVTYTLDQMAEMLDDLKSVSRTS